MSTQFANTFGAMAATLARMGQRVLPSTAVVAAQRLEADGRPAREQAQPQVVADQAAAPGRVRELARGAGRWPGSPRSRGAG